MNENLQGRVKGEMHLTLGSSPVTIPSTAVRVYFVRRVELFLLVTVTPMSFIPNISKNSLLIAELNFLSWVRISIPA